ncbi:Clavaminate synthase-like protein [Tricholoma matsutake]|nr:Clavaminate synthase-like protein [Tricholoma matsutake 945]
MLAWRLSCIQLLVDEWNDVGNMLTQRGFLQDLRSAAQNLLDGISTEASCIKLQAIMHDASEKMISTPKGPALTGWIRLYADAAILRSLADVDATSAVQSLETLDRAIIVCGLAGARLEMILSLIAAIQRYYFSKPSSTFSIGAVSKPVRTEIQLSSSHYKIPSLPEPPSLTTFQSNFADRPFVVRGYAQDWPAMSVHPWWSAAYLRFVSGPGRIVPVEVGKDYRADGWTQMLMPWDDFLSTLDLMDQGPPKVSTQCYYLAQHNLFTQFPALRDDILIPDYVYAAMNSRDFPLYRPPGNDEQLVLNTWLGPGGAISPAHMDPYYNVFVQVVGRKTVWLAPPTLTRAMYPYSSANSRDSAANKTNPSMSNTSLVDVFSADAARKEDFSDFWDQVVPIALHETLEPGDLLFIPPGWWHSMRAEETSFSVSMWF